MKQFGYILALIWGVIWAAVLQFVPLGRFLAARRTWLTVVIGVGIDLLLMRPLLKLADWLKILALIGCSSLGIIARSLYNEWHDHQDILVRVRGGVDGHSAAPRQ